MKVVIDATMHGIIQREINKVKVEGWPISHIELTKEEHERLSNEKGINDIPFDKSKGEHKGAFGNYPIVVID